jgi:hypothetical protein
MFLDQPWTCQYNLFRCQFAQVHHLYQKPPKQRDFSKKSQITRQSEIIIHNNFHKKGSIQQKPKAKTFW